MSPEEALDHLGRDYPQGSPGKPRIDDIMTRIRENGIDVLEFGAHDYPVLLSEVNDPPAVLYSRGNLENALGHSTVAVIGSRRSSIYGRGVARSISRDLSALGVSVVSGLARGIDAEAHMGSLDAGGPTIAVLGSGIDVIYPPEHEKLAERIAGAGALVSEYPPGTRPDKFNFPARNRIISGLSLGVVVVEAGERSGTMITVGTALDQGREVFAVPGEVTRTTSTGTNRLLKDGANLVTCVDDILEVLGIAGSLSAGKPPEVEGEVASAVVRLLSEGPAHIDEMVRRLGLSVSALQGELLVLEMLGHVVRRPGEHYTLV
jgi:DNA processing protein